jgi:hypothetical protein
VLSGGKNSARFCQAAIAVKVGQEDIGRPHSPAALAGLVILLVGQ